MGQRENVGGLMSLSVYGRLNAFYGQSDIILDVGASAPPNGRIRPL